MSTCHFQSGIFRIVCALFITTMLWACAMTTNHSFVGKGPNFEASFAGVQDAMKTKGYNIAKADKGSGALQTEKRMSKNWWWVIDAHVSQDGTVEFRSSGSDHVMKGDKIHPHVLRYAQLLRDTFQNMFPADKPASTPKPTP